MAKELRHTMKPWIEVAPSLIDSPYKSPNSPKLETIREERAEDPHQYEEERREKKNFTRTMITVRNH
ncbi:hypothetical protein SLE2022_197360 [Rubroshorea leprosula]|uniref:Uncharacterized protein n=1 Tax=Rubroshorea leprosula TaxID=152421 RepID=A0AAV5J103_9ROSI|nr:hypothetical protein SLEP1_g19944 [Rubroshorea leprosula]